MEWEGGCDFVGVGCSRYFDDGDRFECTSADVVKVLCDEQDLRIGGVLRY
jgi:hypothetical protein